MPSLSAMYLSPNSFLSLSANSGIPGWSQHHKSLISPELEAEMRVLIRDEFERCVLSQKYGDVVADTLRSL